MHAVASRWAVAIVITEEATEIDRQRRNILHLVKFTLPFETNVDIQPFRVSGHK